MLLNHQTELICRQIVFLCFVVEINISALGMTGDISI